MPNLNHYVHDVNIFLFDQYIVHNVGVLGSTSEYEHTWLIQLVLNAMLVFSLYLIALCLCIIIGNLTSKQIGRVLFPSR